MCPEPGSNDFSDELDGIVAVEVAQLSSSQVCNKICACRRSSIVEGFYKMRNEILGGWLARPWVAVDFEVEAEDLGSPMTTRPGREAFTFHTFFLPLQ